MPSSRLAIARAFAIGNAVIAACVVVAALRLDVRSWGIHTASALLVVLLLWSSFGLLRGTRWRLLALRATAWAGLAIGLGALAVLAVATGQTSHAEGALRATHSLTAVLGLTLLLPYLLLYPCAQLLWAHRQQRHAEPS
jgi:hypothetical protein